MSNDSTRDRIPRSGGRGLWSRIRSALAHLAVAPAVDSKPDTMAGQPLVGDTMGTEARRTLSDRFSSQLFASLLLELPEHRQAFTSAWLASDWQALADCSHRLAGAVAYCDLPELDAALADLKTAIRDGDELVLRQTYNRASREIDELLEKSGLRGS